MKRCALVSREGAKARRGSLVSLSPICYLLSAFRSRRLRAAGYRNSLNPISYLLTPARLGLLALTVLAATGWGQTTLFSDNFETSTGSSYDTSGAIGTSATWSLARSGNDWGAMIHGGRLDLSNDASGTTNADGWVFGYRDINALSGWNTTLSSNTGRVTWEFNMRQIRTDPAGFGSTSYGVAYVLAGTSATAAAGSGYAVVLGESGSTDPIRLVSFNNGVQGTRTTILTSNTSGLTDFAGIS